MEFAARSYQGLAGITPRSDWPDLRTRGRLGSDLARSSPAGSLSPILRRGRVPSRPGGPCALANGSDGFIYIYYLDWGRPLSPGADEIHLARSPVSSDGAPGSWYKYFQGSFDEPGIDGNSDPVIRGPSSTAFWAGFPSVSYNVSLDAYLAVFVSADGFYYSASSDLTNWTVGKKLLTRNETPNTAEPWLLYPSLRSPSQPTDSTTLLAHQAHRKRRIARYQMLCRVACRADRAFVFATLADRGSRRRNTPTPHPSGGRHPDADGPNARATSSYRCEHRAARRSQSCRWLHYRPR